MIILQCEALEIKQEIELNMKYIKDLFKLGRICEEEYDFNMYELSVQLQEMNEILEDDDQPEERVFKNEDQEVIFVDFKKRSLIHVQKEAA